MAESVSLSGWTDTRTIGCIWYQADPQSRSPSSLHAPGLAELLGAWGCWLPLGVPFPLCGQQASKEVWVNYFLKRTLRLRGEKQSYS